MAKSKYNNQKVEVEGIKFDSQVEARYHDQLKWLLANGEILSFTLQPRYLLQEAFKKDGVTHRKTEYVADFEVLHIDRSIEVIDIKGQLLPVFSLKAKLFHKRYPHKLSLLNYSKIDGGWCELSTILNNRKLRKKAKENK